MQIPNFDGVVPTATDESAHPDSGHGQNLIRMPESASSQC